MTAVRPPGRIPLRFCSLMESIMAYKEQLDLEGALNETLDRVVSYRDLRAIRDVAGALMTLQMAQSRAQYLMAKYKEV